MKYKAPVDFAMEIASRFAPMSSAMKEAAATVNVLEEIKRLYEEREKHLERIAELRKQSAARLANFSGKLGTAADLVGGYGAYESWLQADAALAEGEKPAHASEISEYRSRAQRDADTLKTVILEEQARLGSDLAQALSELQAAEQSNASIAAAVARMREEQAGSGFDRLAGANVAGQEASSMTPEELAQFGDTRSSADGLVMNAEWFADYRQELNDQLSGFGHVADETEAFRATLLFAVSSSGAGSALNQAWTSLNEAYQAYSQRYFDPGTVIAARQDELQRRQSQDAERKSNEVCREVQMGPSEGDDRRNGVRRGARGAEEGIRGREAVGRE